VPVAALAAAAREGVASASLRDTVLAARRVQESRGALNAALGGRALQRHVPLDAAGEAFLERAAERLRFSARAHVRIRRLARTIADLEGAPSVGSAHLREAVSYRIEAER